MNYLVITLDQILKNQTIKEIEIIAVDNKSIDGSKKHAKKLGWKVISIDDYSPGKALNLGISASKGSIIIILSSHCFPTNKNFLRNYLNLFNQEVSQAEQRARSGDLGVRRLVKYRGVGLSPRKRYKRYGAEIDY